MCMSLPARLDEITAERKARIKEERRIARGEDYVEPVRKRQRTRTIAAWAVVNLDGSIHHDVVGRAYIFVDREASIRCADFINHEGGFVVEVAPLTGKVGKRK